VIYPTLYYTLTKVSFLYGECIVVYSVYSKYYYYIKIFPSFFFFERKKKYLAKNYITSLKRLYTPTFLTFYTQNILDPTLL
jgi:hypothetical protein